MKVWPVRYRPDTKITHKAPHMFLKRSPNCNFPSRLVHSQKRMIRLRAFRSLLTLAPHENKYRTLST
nr:MAG TPA: hypothetical protein [Caudoviricetes sp.]